MSDSTNSNLTTDLFVAAITIDALCGDAQRITNDTPLDVCIVERHICVHFKTTFFPYSASSTTQFSSARIRLHAAHWNTRVGMITLKWIVRTREDAKAIPVIAVFGNRIGKVNHSKSE